MGFMRFAVNTLIVGVVVIGGGILGFFLIAQAEVRKADETTITISQNLPLLARIAGISLPERPRLDCGHWRFQTMGKVDKMVASVTFNSSVDEAKSAEDAAMRFADTKDQTMMRVAAADAVTRWQHVMNERAEIDCIDIQIQRRNY